MFTVSRKALSASGAATYHANEFTKGAKEYYSEADTLVGTWYGSLANEWALKGGVSNEEFTRIANGQHPTTGAQLVNHQTPRTITNAKGETSTTMEHRAGWDGTFSAPKSVSLTALVGGDARVRAAHDASVHAAIDELEHFIQARPGGSAAAETTHNLIAVEFKHDSSRPVQGYAAPQLHTHVVIFNMTHTASGGVKPLQPLELYRSQQFATAVYRSELARRLPELGYLVERNEQTKAPEIVGYSQEYLDASSPRRKQIVDRMNALGLDGGAAAQVVAHQTREKKIDLTREEVQRAHQEMAARFGHQPQQIVRSAQLGDGPKQVWPPATAREAVTYARDRNIERQPVMDERKLMADALDRSLGVRTLAEVRAELNARVGQGHFREVPRPPSHPARQFTTPEMTALERQNIATMRLGQDRRPPLAPADIRRDLAQHYAHLSDHQREQADRLLLNRDRVQGLEGKAGAGKTTTLAAVRDAADRAGYTVVGLAPTSKAARELGKSGIASMTLQRYLAQPDEAIKNRLLVLDESTLASTVQMRALLKREAKGDRYLLVGNVGQHEAVDAGTPFKQLQEAGMATARLDQIVRQKEPELRAVVELLSRGEIPTAVARLEAQGRLHEVQDIGARYRAITAAYLKDPAGSLVISPDNKSRSDLNETIRKAMQRAGTLEREDHPTRVLVTRNELTAADREWANRYNPGDVIRFTRGSKVYGIHAGAYARVEAVNAKENLLTVQIDGKTVGGARTYDPKRLNGVTVYRETKRDFAVGERVQFTAPDRTLGVVNRELGTVQEIGTRGITLTMDRQPSEPERIVVIPPRPRQHLDHGYAVTSYSSQSLTTGVGLVHVDTTQSAAMVNRQMIYVAASRGEFDLQIFTDNAERLANVLNRDASQQTAIGPQQTKAPQQVQALGA